MKIASVIRAICLRDIAEVSNMRVVIAVEPREEVNVFQESFAVSDLTRWRRFPDAWRILAIFHLHFFSVLALT